MTATDGKLGKVLIVGGQGDFSSKFAAELYDPVTGTWTATGSLQASRGEHVAALTSGKVLVAGGFGSGTRLASSEIYDPQSGTWTSASAMASPRDIFAATMLASGQVLVIGGYGGDQNYYASTELYGLKMTCAPSRASPTAVAKPMPAVEPVISAVFPVRPRSIWCFLRARDAPRPAGFLPPGRFPPTWAASRLAEHPSRAPIMVGAHG